MQKPIVAVVGRPNVGKSTFFNKVVGKRISIIKNTPGVTRDRIYQDAEWCGYNFLLIDTGGLGLLEGDAFGSDIEKEALAAIEMASVVIFLVDGKDGVLPEDHKIAKNLRHAKKKVVLAVNKLDNFDREKTYDFYELGLGSPLALSSEQALGIGDVLDKVIENFSEMCEAEEKQSTIKIAVVGKPNVGKSSLVNKLLGYRRTIVSPIAGTTRDAIDTELTVNGNSYTLIDTAGLRRKRGIEDNSIERYSVLRTIAAIKRADIVLTLFDSSENISEQDIRIAGLVHDELKPQIIVMNKWDTVEKDGFTIEKFEEKLKASLAFMDYYKSIYISAQTGQRVEKVLSLVDTVYQNATRRITTGTLNDILVDMLSSFEPPSKKGRKPKIYYVTQAVSAPPKFIFFVNDPSLFHFSYERYLENNLRRAVDFSGVPISIILKGKANE